MSIDMVLKNANPESILKSERVPVAAMKLVKLMLQTMGCQDDGNYFSNFDHIPYFIDFLCFMIYLNFLNLFWDEITLLIFP